MRHVYVHVPFCARRCSYCDFAIAVRRDTPAAEYLAAITGEVTLRGAMEDGWDTGLETLYIGGGTPSRLPADALASLIALFRPEHTSEVTLEANPDDVTPAAARRWRGAGVNRVSLGVQSFHPHVLEWMHRTHTAEASQHAVEVLRSAGLGTLSLDLIFALPDELHHDVRRDLDAALALDPEHLSVYGLSVEPRTPLARWISRGRTTTPPDDRYADEFLAVHAQLTTAGFEHYEVSSYARRDGDRAARARHNSAYWSGAAYRGVGPAAHGYDGRTRRWNIREWVSYQRAVAERRDPIEGEEHLSDEQRQLERAYLALRTVEGIREAEFPARDHDRLLAATTAGWLTREAGWIRPTPAGWLVLDGLVSGLTTSLEGG